MLRMRDFNWDVLGKVAYAKYAERFPWTATKWDELTEDQRMGWIAAAREACSIYVAAQLA